MEVGSCVGECGDGGEFGECGFEFVGAEVGELGAVGGLEGEGEGWEVIDGRIVGRVKG